jgi:hypothetical protein
MNEPEIEGDSPRKRAEHLFAILHHDLEEHLLKIDDYLHGRHADPYMPETADDEYKLLAKRSITNHIPLLVRAPVQACYVDGFRAGRKKGASGLPDELTESPQWDHWQRSRLDSRQTPVYHAAAGYGHSFVLTEKRGDDEKSTSRGLSPLRTAAIYDDPATDEDPLAALHVVRWAGEENPGEARFWDGPIEYSITFKNGKDGGAVIDFEMEEVGDTGAGACPVTRFATEIDLDGRTRGIIEQVIPLQDRLNQTVFDLLIAQTYGSFKVRYATGMAPPMKLAPKRDEEGNVVGFEPAIDGDGQPIVRKVNMTGKTFLYAENPETKFGSLDETPLDGYIAALKDVSERLSAVTQTPPTYLLGQIANLSAEALNAAEKTFNRKVESYKHSFGEAWERVFRIASRLDGVEGADDVHGEVVWRDMESNSLAAAADAAGKLRQNVEAPVQALWEELPGMTQQKLARWKEQHEEEDSELRMMEQLSRASGSRPDTSTSGRSVDS